MLSIHNLAHLFFSEKARIKGGIEQGSIPVDISVPIWHSSARPVIIIYFQKQPWEVDS